MLDSYCKNVSGSTGILVYISEDDPKIKEYKDVVDGINHEIGLPRCMCNVLNYAALI